MKHLTSYHGHRAEYPTPGQAVALIIGVAALIGWAVWG